jgi:hypothetical protein
VLDQRPQLRVGLAEGPVASRQGDGHATNDWQEGRVEDEKAKAEGAGERPEGGTGRVRNRGVVLVQLENAARPAASGEADGDVVLEHLPVGSRASLGIESGDALNGGAAGRLGDLLGLVGLLADQRVVVRVHDRSVPAPELHA